MQRLVHLFPTRFSTVKDKWLSSASIIFGSDQTPQSPLFMSRRWKKKKDYPLLRTLTFVYRYEIACLPVNVGDNNFCPLVYSSKTAGWMKNKSNLVSHSSKSNSESHRQKKRKEKTVVCSELSFRQVVRSERSSFQRGLELPAAITQVHICGLLAAGGRPWC